MKISEYILVALIAVTLFFTSSTTSKQINELQKQTNSLQQQIQTLTPQYEPIYEADVKMAISCVEAKDYEKLRRYCEINHVNYTELINKVVK